MTEIVIDAQRALELLRNKVHGNENFVYPYAGQTCVYVMNDCPSCLIGQVLADAGVSLKDLRVMDTIRELDIDTDIKSLYQADVLSEDLIITEEAVDIFRIAQIAQDQGQAWGDALANAENWWHNVSNA